MFVSNLVVKINKQKNMWLFQEDSSLSGIQKFVKLAAAVANVHPLLDPYPEPDDSGIDSDDPSPAALQACTLFYCKRPVVAQ